jgi:hypothetical protein
MHVVVPLTPQPIPNVMGEGTWHWIYSTKASITFKLGEDASYLYSKCPYAIGDFFDAQHIVTNISALRSDGITWVWEISLRAAEGDELEAYWQRSPVHTPPSAIVCELCQSTDRVRMVPARTAYADRPNDPLLLCGDCCNDYQEHWDEMWGHYYSTLL